MPVEQKQHTDALQTAVDWFVHLNSGNASKRDWQNFRNWLTRDAGHQNAWQRVETVQKRLGSLPKALSKPVLSRTDNKAWSGKLLSLLFVAGLTLGLAFSMQFSSADYYTVKGEIKTIELADGTELTLNTDTNVAVDYGLFNRTVRLRTGEILIDTAPDTALFKRGFHVDTSHGRITALGTRFNVQLHDDTAEVAVYEGRIAIMPKRSGARKQILNTGDSTEFNNSQIWSITAASEDGIAWSRGMFIADNMGLCRFVAELGRHYANRIFCPGRLADLHISGAFPLDKPERVLKAITLSLPVDIHTNEKGDLLLRPRS